MKDKKMPPKGMPPKGMPPKGMGEHKMPGGMMMSNAAMRKMMDKKGKK